eukprot:TRINITY_DN11801_c0_g5_i1.p1 TRINITY_DN11801_c0_g5~~TRINITY_DN11801_c0_g5_i1.p1  ORF type:complete len:556 (-),score=72.71 TRINITY_DN11801_c0_g5_i1:399-1991(-)
MVQQTCSPSVFLAVNASKSSQIKTSLPNASKPIRSWSQKFWRMPYSVVDVSIMGSSAAKEEGKAEGKDDIEIASMVQDDACEKTLSERGAPPVRMVHWLGMTSFQLVYVCISTSMGVLVIPSEAERFHGKNSGAWVGFYMAICGCTQLACPVVGKLSDRHASRWGRRRPFVAVGGFFSVVCFSAMWFASDHMMPGLYSLALFGSQLALNVVYAAQSGLPADFLGAGDDATTAGAGSAKGIVSGLVAMYTFAGSLLAMSVVIVMREMPVQLEYLTYVLQIALACFAVCISAREVPTHLLGSKPMLTLAEFRETFAIDLYHDMDFFWVCVGRMCYYMSTSIAAFMYFYFRDMVGIRDESVRRLQLGILAIISQCVGVASSVPFGRLSTKLGRKPLIYLSCILMMSTFGLYVVAPVVRPSRVWPVIVLAAMLYGVGSGAYLSVDYALALDCLPKGKTSAEAFGLWGVIGFLGSTLGPIFGSWLLTACQNDFSNDLGSEPEEYTFFGYALLMLVLGCGMNALVVVSTAKIEKVR